MSKRIDASRVARAAAIWELIRSCTSNMVRRSVVRDDDPDADRMDRSYVGCGNNTN